MSVKDPIVYVRHILDCIADVERYIAKGKSVFLGDDLVRNATLRQLQIMSESCMRLTPAIRERSPQIDWRQISGFRNVLAHDYMGVIDFEKIWDIIAHRLPELKEAMRITLENKDSL